VLVSESGIRFELLDGTQAAAHLDDLQELRAEVYADPPYGRLENDARFADRFRVWRRQPGFALAEARNGGFLVGYAAGMPLRPSTSWWRELTASLPGQITAEHPGRTFALTELLVRGSWRRQGIGQELHDLILAGRPEERATLTVLPAAAAAQAAFRTWGWRKVARTRGPEPGAPVSDVLVIALPAARRPTWPDLRLPDKATLRGTRLGPPRRFVGSFGCYRERRHVYGHRSPTAPSAGHRR
jgi:ribosomal protein S18 acetylase RimI-like enzyme